MPLCYFALQMLILTSVELQIRQHGEDHLYSSARNYAEMDSVIDVIKVSVRWKTY